MVVLICFGFMEGYLQGAYFEGVDVATEVIRCIKDSQCAGLGHFDDVVNAYPYRVDA
jgi:polyamine oxidase